MPIMSIRRLVLCALLVPAGIVLGGADRPQDRPKTLVVGNPGHIAPLPPETPWSGKSRELLRGPGDSWATPFEAGDRNTTPRYAAAVAWLEKLSQASPDLEMVSLGKSPQGRDIWMAVASRDHAFDAGSFRETSKPTLLVEACIHGGEVDGKDAGMMLLRDLTVGGSKSALLDKANLLFIPVLNVDGHERFSPFNRMNQRGPSETGWRTNAMNRNLNRDFAKLETAEVRAVVTAIREWEPDLFVDVHVTDGVDYQYDITWGYNGPHAYSPNSSAWLDAYLTPGVSAGLSAMGHAPGPLVFAVDPLGIEAGNYVFTISANLANGYGDARHLPSVLVETHSLKSYERRVLGTYVLLERTLSVLGTHGSELVRAVKADRKARQRNMVLSWSAGEPKQTMEFLGIRSRLQPSAVSGGLRVEYTGDPVTLTVPLVREDVPQATVSRPKAYWIPAEWGSVVEKLRQHGIETETLEEPREVPVTRYRLENVVTDPAPTEGRLRVTAEPVPEQGLTVFPPGTVRVSTDQPLGDLAVLLLEPESPTSFFQWGFFLEILNRTEEAESYVMEPMASEMLTGNPELAAEFMKKLRTDPEFAGSAKARLDWFYEHTPFFDQTYLLYPVAREE